MKRLRNSGFLVLFILSGCAIFEPTAQNEENYELQNELQRYRSFFVMNSPLSTVSDSPFFQQPALVERSRTLLIDGFEGAGLRHTSTDAQLTVYFYWGVDSESQLGPLPYQVSARSPLFLSESNTEQRIGSRKLIVDLVDNGQNFLVWRGIDSLSGSMTTTNWNMQVPAMIQRITTKFP